jgi:hypothetical protein
MIEPKYGTLQTLFADRVFRIPHYQRFYCWLTHQRRDLFSDLEKLSRADAEQHHFMATIVCHKTTETRQVGTSQYRVYDLVDGQQRLTTLIILLKCIEMALAQGSDDRQDLAKILVKRDGNLILLQTNNANEYMFNRFIRDGLKPQSADVKTYSDRNLAKGISECMSFVAEWEGRGELNALMGMILHRLGFVAYDTEDRRVVYTVFEVLNSRGLAVDWLDKAKSVLMGKAFEHAESTEAADAEIQSLQNIWSDLYREIAKHEIAGDEALRTAATLYYGTGAGRPLSAEGALERLRASADTFGKPRQISHRLLEVSKTLGTLYGNVFLGAVTEIMHARILAVAILSATGITPGEQRFLMQQWERVTFRIFGLGHNDSRAKIGDYVRLAIKIANDDMSHRTYNQIMGQLRELGSEHPIEMVAESGLAGKDAYPYPEMSRYILWCYEEHLAEEAGRNATWDESERSAIWRQRAAETLEHIYPENPWGEPGWDGKLQNPAGEDQNPYSHMHRIGNLMLLPQCLNSEASRRPFEVKKDTYRKHNLRMVAEVCAEDGWNLETIERRERKIVDWAKNRWADI